jgi:hypothetical protein
VCNKILKKGEKMSLKSKIEDIQDEVHDQQRLWIEDMSEIVAKFGENYYYLVNNKFNELIDELDLAVTQG